ncbi:HD domain-containing phosphohydrolase [Helicobacter sp. 11S02596-1]|uniref:HD domain-containing phosphohydrolase n=1 Tax=Helicobacter sp. 11S02596-1 TaxID=1476194 RepID=UPI000BA597B3|nr:HD domain-containing phosphohydrolase [Helicobacter sp. 11S02596-1]PAF42433.1 hypothetical protein BJI48_06380 [Helicobacter sp. 11S02596-1]
MRLVNIIFKDKKQLQVALESHQIHSGAKEKYFIQVFGPLGREMSEYLIDVLNELLPGCEILLASSCHQAFEFKVLSEICLGISCFCHSDVKTAYFPAELEETQMATAVISELITKRTKLLIVFIEYFSVSGEVFLNEIFRLAPNLVVCGGKAAGSNIKATRTLIGNTQGVYVDGLVCAVIDSDVLNIQNSYIFGWRPIGLRFEVTKSFQNVVYEINHTPIKEIYGHYLGENALDDLGKTGWNFPFVLEDSEGNLIGRVLDKVQDDGGISFLGIIPEGASVKFSFGFLENVKKDLMFEDAHRPKNSQAIYMYSSVGRISFLGLEGINELLNAFTDTDCVCGFFTFGEIYHFAKSNAMMNLANTRVILSEEPFDFKTNQENMQIQWSEESTILNTITHLSEVTSRELDVASGSLKSYKDLITEAMQYIEINKDLKITDVNDRICEVSGYPREQHIGKNVLEFLNAEMGHYTLNEIVPTLQRNGIWSGKMSHIRADGSLYYTNTFVKAVFDNKRQILSYIVGEIDRTDEEMRQRRLENDVKLLQYSDEEKQYLLSQYENFIDGSQILFRLDLQRNFIYTNPAFLEVFGFESHEVLGRNLYEFLDDTQKQQFLNIGKALNEKGIYKGVISWSRNDGERFYVNALGMYIYDLAGKPLEIMAAGTDITKIVQSQKEIESVQKDIIFTMGTICEGKSRETGNHIKRVAEYSQLLAKLYGCTSQEQELIYIASPMHDIGKIGIPDSILNKPGKLTPEEFEVMKTHTTLGAEMLKGSNRIILETASQIARSHHEWWGGGGYPDNLSGEEIPLFGRITALVDVFDAISNDRVYKKAWPLCDVITYIQDLKGKQFQPELVDLFLGHIDDFLVISHHYKD